MKNIVETQTEQYFLELESLFLKDINTLLEGRISPIYKITDLTSEQWFDLAEILLFHNIGISSYARQIGIDMAQKRMPLAAYMR